MENSIVAIFFKDENEVKVLSRIVIKDEKVIKGNSFNNINFENQNEVDKLITQLKIIYEDFGREKFN